MIRRILIVLAAAALLAGCRGGPDYLGLSWRDFDQNPDGGWRTVADAGDYAGAAAMIEDYLAHRPDIEPAQRAYSTYHAGQLWAIAGETERALPLLDRAYVPDPPQGFPRSFNALAAGTAGFLRGDFDAVRAARDEVAAMTDRRERDDQFLASLEVLLRSGDLTYRQIHENEMR